MRCLGTLPRSSVLLRVRRSASTGSNRAGRHRAIAPFGRINCPFLRSPSTESCADPSLSARAVPVRRSPSFTAIGRATRRSRASEAEAVRESRCISDCPGPYPPLFDADGHGAGETAQLIDEHFFLEAVGNVEEHRRGGPARSRGRRSSFRWPPARNRPSRAGCDCGGGDVALLRTASRTPNRSVRRASRTERGDAAARRVVNRWAGVRAADRCGWMRRGSSGGRSANRERRCPRGGRRR